MHHKINNIKIQNVMEGCQSEIKALLSSAASFPEEKSVDKYFLVRYHKMLDTLINNSDSDYDDKDINKHRLPKNKIINGYIFKFHVDNFSLYLNTTINITHLNNPYRQFFRMVWIDIIGWIKNNKNKIIVGIIIFLICSDITFFFD
ncbi:MAG: hypothetical protein KAR54_00815 [Candidatus Pacebacteria bacterium]|nr:hypothetical protein [Candidatus Paceibacterota bacterium]